MRAVLVAVSVCLSLNLYAGEIPQNGFSAEENSRMAQANAETAMFDIDYPTLFSSENPLSFRLLDDTEASAYAEYNEAGYLIFSSNFAFQSRKAKLTMAEHLPKGVQLVIFTGSKSKGEAQRIKDLFSPYINRERVTVVFVPGAANGFWARDGVPVPVFRKSEGKDEAEFFTVVDARYSRFEQDQRFQDFFTAEMTSYSYFFEGGNFIANDNHHCLVVNKTATAQIPDKIFRQHYGCKVLTRLPHVKGIGHADESVKFIDDNTVLTDEQSYVDTLEGRGYEVILLPRPDRQYETYVNSLIVNGVVYVPVFNETGDEKALQIYRDAGFKHVYGINSSALSNNGLGSLHCITMTYPPMEMSQLLQSLGGSVAE